MKLVLLRHPPAAVEQGVCYGASDPPPAPGWERWVEDVRRLIASLPEPVTLNTSPLARCRRPAGELGVEAIVDQRLREMDFGTWEGRRWDEIPRADIERWSADLVNVAPPEGETLADLHARAVAYMEWCAQANSACVVAVSHGGPIRCMLAHALATPLEHLFRLRVDPGSVSVVSIAPGAPVVELVNLTVGR